MKSKNVNVYFEADSQLQDDPVFLVQPTWRIFFDNTDTGSNATTPVSSDTDWDWALGLSSLVLSSSR